MGENILSMTPLRFLDFWKVEGELPFCIITVRGISGVYKLDEISSFIWLYLDGSHTVDSIISEICNNFSGAERGQVKQDVIEVLKRQDADDLIILDYNSLYPFKELNTIKKIGEKQSSKKKSQSVGKKRRRKRKVSK